MNCYEALCKKYVLALTHLVELRKIFFSYLQNIDVSINLDDNSKSIYGRVRVHLMPAPVESAFEYFFIADDQWENFLGDLSSIISWN